MSVPKPEVPLENICSVIFDNVLYTYSSEAFQSLSLSEGAEWERLPMGVAVEGGVCVGTTPQDSASAAFYVVGGQRIGGEGSEGDASGCEGGGEYQGLQKFTYATGKWETICPTAPVTQHRRWHGATYINSTDSLLVYAGRQDGVEYLSSQTFTIKASSPYQVLAFESTAPPAVSPILLPWSESQAVMVGGDPTNRRVMLFSESDSWTDSGATLADALAPEYQAALVDGDDGCKNLYTFNMAVSPNAVNRVVLLDSEGTPVQNSPTIGSRDLSERNSHSDGDLTLEHWPSYNGTLASSTTRSNFAIADDPSGRIVFAGGDEEDVLCVFEGRQNCWEKASSLFAAQREVNINGGDIPTSSARSQTTLVSVTGTTSSTSTSTLESISGEPSGSSDDDKMDPNVILGIALGAIAGVLLLLGLLLFIIRRYQKKKYMEAGHARRASGAASLEKDGFGFATDVLPPGPGGHFRGHQHQDSHNSFSSMAILMGRVNHKKGGVQRKPSDVSVRSDSSSLVNKEFKSTIGKPIPQHLSNHPALQMRDDKNAVSFAPGIPDQQQPRRTPAVDRQGSTRRSSGWNRYWSGGSVLNSLGIGTSRRTTVDSNRTASSHYSNDYRVTQDSATVPALNLDGRPVLNRVSSGSPTVSQHNRAPLREGLTGRIESDRPTSAGSGYSSGIPASVHDTWDPLTSGASRPWGSDRAPGSSAYGGGFYPGLTTGGSTAADATERPETRPPPTGMSRLPQLATAARSSDMSWLNLGK